MAQEYLFYNVDEEEDEKTTYTKACIPASVFFRYLTDFACGFVTVLLFPAETAS